MNLDGAPDHLRQPLHRLIDNVTALHGNWNLYRDLFAKSEERVDFLNQCAGGFFQIIQHVLMTNMIMDLCRLADPEKTGKNDNLSLKYILKKLEGTEVFDAAQTYSERFGRLAKKAGGLRNKVHAHNDLHIALFDNERPENLSREEVEDLLEAVREFLNCIIKHYTDSVYGFEYFEWQESGDTLMYLLSLGLKAHEEMHADIDRR